MQREPEKRVLPGLDEQNNGILSPGGELVF